MNKGKVDQEMGVILWRTGRSFAWGKGEALGGIDPFAEVVVTLGGKTADSGNVGVRARLAAAVLVELLGHKLHTKAFLGR